MPTALISVYSKDGIVDFATELVKRGWDILASGGTAKKLMGEGVAVRDISTIVGEPILGHRVVTLSRQIHAALLARNTQDDQKELDRIGMPRIDLVCVDLYPLVEEISKPSSTRASVIEQTDVGGPTLLHAAAKGERIVICDPKDRAYVLYALDQGMFGDDQYLRDMLAAKAEVTVARYCLESARYRSGGEYEGFIGKRVATCRYGENGWQTPACLYSTGTDDPLALDKFVVIEGSSPSYNNWVDVDRLLQTVSHISAISVLNGGVGEALAVGDKHGNACGGAAAADRREAAKQVIAGDPLAIFGGLAMMNFEVDEELAAEFVGKGLDGIMAPAFTPGAVAMLRRKGDKCRFIVNPALRTPTLDQAIRFRYVRGGFLVQPNYTFVPDLSSEEVKKYGTATPQQEADMLLAWAIGSTSNSNTITLVKDGHLIGNGVGQQDRVGAAKLAVDRARRSGHDVAGAAGYSDSFFPFPDGVQALIDAGVTSIFTTSGSRNDQTVIDLCAKHNVVLYMVPDPLGRGFYGH